MLEAEHSLEFYPVSVRSLALTEPTTCTTQEEFEDLLGEILSSDQVRKVISALLAQITEEAVPS